MCQKKLHGVREERRNKVSGFKFQVSKIKKLLYSKSP
jgi:hypothetical protein